MKDVFFVYRKSGLNYSIEHVFNTVESGLYMICILSLKRGKYEISFSLTSFDMQVTYEAFLMGR